MELEILTNQWVIGVGNDCELANILVYTLEIKQESASDSVAVVVIITLANPDFIPETRTVCVDADLDVVVVLPSVHGVGI